MRHTSHVGFGLAAIASALLLGGCSEQSPVAPREVGAVSDARGARNRGGDRYVLRAKNGVSPALRKAVAAAGGSIEREHDSIGVLAVRGLSAAAVSALARRGDVESMQHDMVVRWIPQGTGNIHGTLAGPTSRSDQSGAFFFPTFQWNMRVTRASNAWLVTNQGEGALVCILDSGVDPGHQDLQGRVDLSKSTSMVVNEPFIEDLNLHGTFVSALVSSNGIGIASVAPDARLCAVKVLDYTGQGSFSDLISGIVFATDAGADVINMSLGAYFSRKEEGARQLIRALQRAIDFANRHGVLVVAAAGNDTVDLNHDPRDFISVPAELNHVLSVGATAPVGQENFDQLASYSDYGSSGVDVFAPGGDFIPGESVQQDLIMSACSRYSVAFDCSDGATYLLGSGTSFAAPHVAGEAAVIESNISRDQRARRIEQCILKTADRVTNRRRDPVFGRGRINVLNAAACGGGRNNGHGRGHRQTFARVR